jgi:raffinose/stachyose/melibiose transport system permease protein
VDEVILNDRALSAERKRTEVRPSRFRPGPARRGDILWGYILLLPAVAFLGALLVEPFVKAVQYSLESWDGIGPARYVGFENYRHLWTDPIERSSLYHLGILFCFYSLIPTAAGLIAAALVRRSDQRGMGFFRIVLFLPQVIVTVVAALVWTWILAPSGEASVNGLLNSVHLGPDVGRPWLGSFSTALVAVGLVAVWLDFGLCFVLFLSGIQRISPEIYDAARVDGTGFFREFTRLTVPLLRREIGAALTISVVVALQSFTLVYVATNGGPGYATTVPGLLVYRFGFQLGQVGDASALGIAMTAIIFGLTFVVRALIERNAT